MRSKEEIQAQIDPLRAELQEIEDKERTKSQKALLGKCYRYHNSYGGDRQKWWLYAKVTHLGDWWPRVFTFQTTCEDEIIVKSKDFISVGNGYDEITEAEFKKEWKKLASRIALLKP